MFCEELKVVITYNLGCLVWFDNCYPTGCRSIFFVAPRTTHHTLSATNLLPCYYTLPYCFHLWIVSKNWSNWTVIFSFSATFQLKFRSSSTAVPPKQMTKGICIHQHIRLVKWSCRTRCDSCAPYGTIAAC